MPRYGVYSPRYFTLLSGVREAAPPEEWIHKAIQAVKAEEKPLRWRKVGQVWRLTR